MINFIQIGGFPFRSELAEREISGKSRIVEISPAVEMSERTFFISTIRPIRVTLKINPYKRHP